MELLKLCCQRDGWRKIGIRNPEKLHSLSMVGIGKAITVNFVIELGYELEFDSEDEF